MEINKDEAKIISDMADKISVTGKEGIQLVSGLLAKLEAFIKSGEATPPAENPEVTNQEGS